MGYIYFVESAGFVKIGFTFHIPTRFHELQIAAPEKLRLLRYDIGTREIESSYHSRFAALRSSGEWFRIEGELSEFLSQRDKSKTEFLNRRADVVRTVK